MYFGSVTSVLELSLPISITDMATAHHRSRMLASIFALWLSKASAQGGGLLWANASTPTLSMLSSSSISTSLDLLTRQPWPSSSSQITSNLVGDFIAAGLGMTRASSVATSSLATMNSDQITPTSSISSTPMTTSQKLSASYTLIFTGDCWEQWRSFWSATSSASSAWTRISTLAISTYTFTDWSISATTERFSGTTIVIVRNGAFAQTTFTTITCSTIDGECEIVHGLVVSCQLHVGWHGFVLEFISACFGGTDLLV